MIIRHTTPSPARRSPSLAALAALAAVAALAATGCATARPPVAALWPSPPQTARIQMLRSIRKASDLEPGFGRRFLNAFLPGDPDAVIASVTGLALSPDERRLYVACGGRARVVVIDRQARTMKVFPTPGLQSAMGVAVDGDENVFVTDRLKNAVLEFDRRGAPVRTFGKELFQGPTGVAVDRTAQVLYVLNGALTAATDHRVEVFSLAGKHLRTIGHRGGGPSEFNFPSSVAVAPDGTLFVSDMLNFRVQMFDRGGALVGSFGELGTGIPGSFDKIKGIAFDAFRNIYIVDAEQGVHIMNQSHRPLLLFGERPLTGTPAAIVIDSKNRIYVGDNAMNAVHQFQLVNTTAADSEAPPEPAPKKAAGSDVAPRATPAKQAPGSEVTPPGPPKP